MDGATLSTITGFVGPLSGTKDTSEHHLTSTIPFSIEDDMARRRRLEDWELELDKEFLDELEQVLERLKEAVAEAEELLREING